MAKQNDYNSLNANFKTCERHGTPFWTEWPIVSHKC